MYKNIPKRSVILYRLFLKHHQLYDLMNGHSHSLETLTLGNSNIKLKISSIDKDIVELNTGSDILYYDIDSFRPDMRPFIHSIDKNGIPAVIEWEEEDVYLSLSVLHEYAPKMLYQRLKYPQHHIIQVPRRIYVRHHKDEYIYRNIR